MKIPQNKKDRQTDCCADSKIRTLLVFPSASKTSQEWLPGYLSLLVLATGS